MTLRLRHLSFRIFYSTTFSILVLLLALLLLITPGDAISQSFENSDLWGIVTIAACHLCALLVCLFLYATRIYTTRSHLAAVPRSNLPVRKVDAPPKVRRLIAEGLERSAAIAYRAYPRDPSPSPLQAAPYDRSSVAQDQALPGQQDSTIRWSHISHVGWSSPSASIGPSLHYASVVLELPHLVEAKAVSLAPPAPPTALLALLQRRPASSLRAYLTHLATLVMLPPSSAMPLPAAYFLPCYDRARFGASPLSEQEFEVLMTAFGSLLAVLAPPPEGILSSLPPSDETDLESDYNSDQSRSGMASRGT